MLCNRHWRVTSAMFVYHARLAKKDLGQGYKQYTRPTPSGDTQLLPAMIQRSPAKPILLSPLLTVTGLLIGCSYYYITSISRETALFDATFTPTFLSPYLHITFLERFFTMIYVAHNYVNKTFQRTALPIWIP